MSADRISSAASDEQRITIDDVKHRAVAVRDLAASEARRAARTVFAEKATRAAVLGVVAVVALTSFAYYLGTRRSAR